MANAKRKENRRRAREAARELLAGLVDGTSDVYEAYRRLYVIWCGNNAAVQELRPLFRIPGVAPDGPLSVTEDFKRQVLSIALTILPSLQV